MIVIAIIGVLTAIAIPNFIAYRNKSFCSTVESDANAIATAIFDYYTIPNRTNYPPSLADLGLTLSNGNTMIIGGNIGAITIEVKDNSGRCPAAYQVASADWTNGVFTKNM